MNDTDDDPNNNDEHAYLQGQKDGQYHGRLEGMHECVGRLLEAGMEGAADTIAKEIPLSPALKLIHRADLIELEKLLESARFGMVREEPRAKLHALVKELVNGP